jgi:hypothetical protein
MRKNPNIEKSIFVLWSNFDPKVMSISGCFGPQVDQPRNLMYVHSYNIHVFIRDHVFGLRLWYSTKASLHKMYCICRRRWRYWSILELDIRLHKQIHILKGIWTMLGVRWSPSPFVFHIIINVFSSVHTIHIGYVNSYFSKTMSVYSNLFHSHILTILILWLQAT